MAKGPLPEGPLGATAREVSLMADWFDLVVPDSGGRLPQATAGWSVCSDLLAGPDALLAWQQRLAASLQARHGSPAPALTVEQWVRESYLSGVSYAGAFCFLLAGRVPRLGPAALAMSVEGTRPARVGLLDPTFGCLPADPAARSAYADVLPDADALAGRLRAEVAAHGAAFLAAEPRTVRRSSQQLQAAVTDALAAALSLGAQLLGGPATAPRHRIGCCYVDKLPGSRGVLCSGCPRLRASGAEGVRG